ncbi:2-hydroxyacid dehydrogenase [Anditalea andensis]|uniref:Hydroxyacid dehydrogenase n=1 Tax=Anditalea andensis TaxID=1048983 RepID=A0A074L0L6_9BACT|nr:glyoxylate/hydroxypyruvate reductase A [Anditalea andensis]KEO74015.1 hydroxyacid dehydrogenase [Anditalea andensis]
MKVAIIAPGRNVAVWKKIIEQHNQMVQVEIYPDISHRDDIEMVMLWQHPSGILKDFKNLKFISSMGAGVDHILKDPDVSSDIPITRVKDDQLTFSMTNYVIMGILNHHRRLNHFADNKKNKNWDMTMPEVDVKIGVMGVGELGGDVLDKLKYMGFRVAGYGYSKKASIPYPYYYGDQLADFLRQVNVVVCLLPLTPKTEGIMDNKFFEQCQTGTYIINVARGKHLVEEDLMEALVSGKISGALLDVYRKEPLPETHPFWEHPAIMMTPHIASVTNPEAAAPQIAENCSRFLANKPLNNIIDRNKGY